MSDTEATLNSPSTTRVSPNGHAYDGSDGANTGGSHEQVTRSLIGTTFELIDGNVTLRDDAEAFVSAVEFGAPYSQAHLAVSS